MTAVNAPPTTGQSTTTALVAAPRVVWAAFWLIALVTVAAIFTEAVSRILPGWLGPTFLAACFGVGVGLIAVWLAPRLAPWLVLARTRLDATAPWRLLLVIVATGLALRLGCAALLGPVVTSDGAVYLGLAKRLLEGRAYVDPRGDLAYWPPGYPMSLAAAGLFFGLAKPAAAILAVNLLSYLAATVGAFLLGRWLYGSAVGLAAAALLAVWPNLVIGVSGASKELPALGLLTAAVALYVLARRRNDGRTGPGNLSAAFACGLGLGMASLVQPALMFLPSAVLLAEMLQPSTLRAAVARLVLIIAGMVVVIAPWSMRNAEQLGATVPIATNGGDVLYRANNPLAVPGYLAEGPVDLRQYPEVERSRLGVRLALEWIGQEPHRFLVLAGQRLMHFSGDNSTSAYDAFRRDESDLKHRFVALKAFSNAAWLAFWLLILVGLANGSLQSAKAPGAWLLVLSYLYLAAMDSIAESGARHHVPFAGLLAVLAAAALCGRAAVAGQAMTSGQRSGAAQFVDFAAVGAVGTAAHFATLILLVQSVGWPPALATTAGFVVGAAVNYGLNYHLTFQSRARHAAAMPRFLAIALASMLLNVATVWALVHWQSAHYLLGQVVATTLVLVLNFVANRALTFGPPRSA